MALARVHTYLAGIGFADGSRGDDTAVVDTRRFIEGLCADIRAAQMGEGLRPVALVVEAEAHTLDTERAVQLGLVLNEAVTNALKFAFPEDRAGTVRVGFAREGDEFMLAVADDGIGLPAEGELQGAPPAPPPRGSGLGTRLLRALAAQLRGTFSRQPGECGRGTVASLRFPAAPPGRPPFPSPL
jgi:two-component sensor histidine kinase